MAVMVRTCCCGCDLRTGILLIGIFGLIGSAFSVYAGYNSFKDITKAKKELDGLDPNVKLPVDRKYLEVVLNLGYARIGFGAISLVINLLLLASYGTRNRYLAYPWVLWGIFELVYTLGVTIFLMAIWNGFAAIFVGTILSWVLSIYFIIVVFSYIEALREDPSGVSAGFDGMVIAGPPSYAKF